LALKVGFCLNAVAESKNLADKIAFLSLLQWSLFT